MGNLKKSIKLLAIDLDETLVRSDNSVSAYTKDVIKRAQEKGIEIVIATGRMYQTAKPIGLALELGDIPMILYSGGVIQRIESGYIEWEHRVPLEPVHRLINHARQEDWYIQAYVNDELLVHHQTWQSGLYEKQTGAKACFIGDSLFNLREEPNKLIIIDKPEKIENIQAYLLAHFSDQLTIVHSQANFIEIIGPHVSKGTALQARGQALGIALEDMVMFGNSENDISMLSLPGYAVAVANAEASVKAIADEVCESNENDGVAHWIEENILEV